MTKRPDGELEQEVLSVLWGSDRALLPAEVNERLDSRLAYTSVATVLSRLYSKGLAVRDPVGRAFAYKAAVGEAELAARRITDVLDAAADRGQVLAGFVGSLSPKEARALRALLEDEGE